MYLGRDENGKRIDHNETFHGERTKAKIRAAELEVELKRRTGPKHLTLNLGEYLEKWLKDIQGTVSDRTFETYKRHVKRIIQL
ncbi:MAG: hypothetical protein PHS52_03320 [Desulfotomaculaceae bacterium]|nr:hypothetical protein [Desulfotomaculaceae bacterium]